MKKAGAFLFSFIALCSAGAVFAHTEAGTISPADLVRERSITIALWASGISLVLMLIAMFAKNASNELKKLLFALIIIAIVGPTIYFIGSTINLNLNSVANGPVHWHADFEIVACGEELPPPNAPHKLSNKTGTPVLHQHVDKRYHVEGVVLDLEEVALDRFFEVQGGTLTENTFRVPTGDTIKTFINGDACPGGEQGVWNVFLYKVDEATHTATQTKLADYVHYTPSAHELVPPGDCLIFEFGPERAYTDRLCNFYQIAVNKGVLKVEVPATDGAESRTQGAIDTSDWQTYRNEEAGFEFEYPGGITIAENSREPLGVGRPTLFLNIAEESIQDLFENCIIRCSRYTTQAGLAIEMTSMVNDTSLFINLGTQVIEISHNCISYEQNPWGLWCSPTISDEVFTHILSSIRMTKQDQENEAVSNWELYSNTQYGFQFQHPKDIWCKEQTERYIIMCGIGQYSFINIAAKTKQTSQDLSDWMDDHYVDKVNEKGATLVTKYAFPSAFQYNVLFYGEAGSGSSETHIYESKDKKYVVEVAGELYSESPDKFVIDSIIRTFREI